MDNHLDDGRESIPTEENLNTFEAELAPDITRIFDQIPGFREDVYLRMQAINLHLVDDYIRQLESNLLKQYIQKERTPVQEAMFVSALSQLWILGLYELLRTWRQRVHNVLGFAERIKYLNPDEVKAFKKKFREDFVQSSINLEETATFAFAIYERVGANSTYADHLRRAFDASELLFRRIEALRMCLAKHELPGQKGVTATAPGYGRIDMSNGSIYWQVELTQQEVDVVSRRSIAQELSTLIESIDHRVLNSELQAKIRTFPKFSYALKKVTAVLKDGQRFPGTLIAWNKIIVAILERDDVPFDAIVVADVLHEDGHIDDGTVADQQTF